MAYTKQTWVNTKSGETPLSEDRLNHMEDGIEAAQPESNPVIQDLINDIVAIQADYTTSTELDAAVDAAVAALVDAAPLTLDTLNELAAALGDDPNFATTVTNSLANKQPLDSDLTAIAALTTTAFGRAVLTWADAAAGRTALALGTAATSNTTAFASAAQGTLADTAIQPADLSTVATTGAYGDLTGTPSLSTVATTGDYDDLIDKPTLGTAAAMSPAQIAAHADTQAVLAVVVNHAADDSVVRPTNAELVIWKGSVTPLNMVAGDIFSDTTP